MIDENELMLNVKNGQINCLANLFENNQVNLFNYFLRMGASSALSEDLVQETFIRILAYRTTYNAGYSFKAWLYRIAKNTISDHFRKRSNQKNHDVFDDAVIESQNNLSDELEQELKQSHFNKALAMLPKEQSEIIILSRFQQLNYMEIAELLNCNINTLKTRMRLAIKQLKKQYQIVSGEVES